MRKTILFSLLSTSLALTGCADLPGMGVPPTPMTPATPVFFQSFSAALDEAALTTIAAAAKAANAEPDARVTVIGAADTVGSMKANKYLSETRAQVVSDALVADGVAQSRIKIKAVGEVATPTADGTPGTPAQAGRRVLISISG
jgi:outer membrane protein OmpA-like peptidoglycan-associated protein